MRVVEGMIVIEFPSAYAANAGDYFAKVCFHTATALGVASASVSLP